jgi:hypothetical protein
MFRSRIGDDHPEVAGGPFHAEVIGLQGSLSIPLRIYGHRGIIPESVA